MGHYWLATLPPLLAVADSPKEWGIIGALFIVSMALIRLIDRFMPRKGGGYSESDRELAKKITEIMSARDGDGMPRIWTPASLARGVQDMIKAQHESTEAMRDLLRTQKDGNDMMRKIYDSCTACRAANQPVE